MTWHQRYIGIPFVDNGRSFAGCDCGGLAWLVFKRELGNDLPCFDIAYSAYDSRSAGVILRRSLNRFFVESEPGPLVLAVFGRRFTDYHVGVFVDRERILHCKDGEHAKVEYLDAMVCRADYRGAYAIA